MGIELVPLRAVQEQSTRVTTVLLGRLRGLRGALNLSPIMRRDATLSDIFRSEQLVRGKCNQTYGQKKPSLDHFFNELMATIFC